MKPAQMRITQKAGAEIRAAPGSGGAAHCLPPDHGGICVILCSVALLLSAGLVNATDIDASSFRCITKMTPVRQFYVDNLQGNRDATLAAANSTTGAVYPTGSVIQLIPGEPWSSATGASTLQRMIGSSSSSTCRKMEHEFANEGLPMWSIDLAETALTVTFLLPRNGILCARPIMVAPRSRLLAR